jgi:hypothetical protein
MGYGLWFMIYFVNFPLRRGCFFVVRGRLEEAWACSDKVGKTGSCFGTCSRRWAGGGQVGR